MGRWGGGGELHYWHERVYFLRVDGIVTIYTEQEAMQMSMYCSRASGILPLPV